MSKEYEILPLAKLSPCNPSRFNEQEVSGKYSFGHSFGFNKNEIKTITKELIQILLQLCLLLTNTMNGLKERIKNSNRKKYKRTKKCKKIPDISCELFEGRNYPTFHFIKKRKRTHRKKKHIRRRQGNREQIESVANHQKSVKHLIKSQIKRAKLVTVSTSEMSVTGKRKRKLQRLMKKQFASSLIKNLEHLESISPRNYNSKEYMLSMKELFDQFKQFPEKPTIILFPVHRQNLNGYLESLPSSASLSTDSMRYEMLRLQTFAAYPLDSPARPIRLAEAGFYSTGSGNEVKCYACGQTYRNWTTGDNPRDVHYRISPNCSHLQGIGETNVAISINSNQRSNVEHTTGVDSSTTEPSATVSATTTSKQQVDEKAQQQGLQQLQQQQRNHEQQEEPQQTQQQPQQQENLQQQRQLQGSQNQASGQTSSSRPTQSAEIKKSLDPLGINFDRPKYPSYAVLTVRISSFQGWPSYLSQTPRVMAVAGFFYAGYSDYCRCFFCGGGLRNWESGDDPWVEHARWFPKCAFLRQNKGTPFVELVLQAHAQLESNSGATANGSSPTVSSEKEKNLQKEPPSEDKKMAANSYDMTTLPAFQSVISMGYKSEQINAAIDKIKKSSNETIDQNFPSAPVILETIFAIEESSQGTSGDETNNSQQTYSTGNVQSQGSDPLSSMANGLAVVTINDDTQSLIDENRKLKEDRLCKICMDEDSSIAFLPCGHLVCCGECAPAMRKCPVCRETVKGTVKTWLI